MHDGDHSLRVSDGDVDQLHELESLRQQLDHWERLATLGTMCSQVAHEFNNILTPVTSYAQMALSNESDPEFTRKALRKALAGAEQASRIAAAILGYSRHCGPGEVANQPSDASVGEAIEQALLCMGRHPEKDGIDLTVDLEPDLQAAIAPVALQHIVLNLLLNSRDAVSGGGMEGREGSMSIRGWRSSSPPTCPGSVSSDGCSTWNMGGSTDWIALEIEDSGRGMSRGRLDQMFAPFSSDGQDGHTGLGLATCARLAHEYGGRLMACSREGVGTRIVLALPVPDAGVARRAA